MFFYFPVKQTDGTVIGRVRAENGRAVLTLSHPIQADFSLFADGNPVPLLPDQSVLANVPEGLIGLKDGEIVCSGTTPSSSLSPRQMQQVLSQIRTSKSNQSTEFAKEEPSKQKETTQPLQNEPNFVGNVIQDGAFFSQDREDLRSDAFDTNPIWEQLPSEPMNRENPLYLRAKSVFSRLMRRSDSNEENDSLGPKTVHNVDKLVDNSSEIFQHMNQKQDTPMYSDGRTVPNRQDTASAAPQNGGNSGGRSDPLLGWRGTPLQRITLFPRIFPGATWRFVADDGIVPHFEGTWQHSGERIRILAVRGTYAPQPPEGLSGFTRYLRADGAGYWVRLISLGRV